MKAEHRHELKTNELAQWLANLPEWANKNLRIIIYISVVIVLVLGAWLWKVYQKKIVAVSQRLQLSSHLREFTQNQLGILQQQVQGTDVSYVLLQSANKLQTFARNINRPDMAALAFIKYAQALRTELHYRMGRVDNQMVSAQIAKAKSAYEDAIAHSQDNPTHRAMATFGLGLCEEETGNFQKATEIYQQLAEDERLAFTPAAASARFRLKIMDSYKEIVTFMEPPPVGAESGTQMERGLMPDINMAGPDANLDESMPAVVNFPLEE